MPIRNCKVNGKKGYKYGRSGKCFRQRKKAVKQGQAINLSKMRKQKFNYEKHTGYSRPNLGE